MSIAFQRTKNSLIFRRGLAQMQMNQFLLLVFEAGSLRATLNHPSQAAIICFSSQAVSSASYLPGLFRGISSGTGKKVKLSSVILILPQHTNTYHVCSFSSLPVHSPEHSLIEDL